MSEKLKICADINIPLLKECFDSKFEFVKYENSENIRDLLLVNKSEFLFCRSTIKVNQELLDGTNIKFAATATSGTDHLDKDYLLSKNISYYDALGSNSNAVAEYIIFSILRHLKNDFSSLKNKKIGVVGFGNVGSKISLYAKNIGLQVFVNDPPLLKNGFNFPPYVEYRDLEYICENCDIITNHIPLEFGGEHPTYNLFSENKIALLKQNTLFLHASRGKTLDENCILKYKEEKNLSLVFDVWEREPLANKALAKLAIIATPHIAGHSYEGKLRGSLMVAKAFENYTKIDLNKSPILSELEQYKPSDIDFYQNLENLFEILKKKRLILNDSEEFKNSMNLSDIEREKYFKNFRKNYPIRRETL